MATQSLDATLPPRRARYPLCVHSINGTASTSFGDTSFCDTYLLRLANLAAQWQVAPPRAPRVAASLAFRSIAPPPAGPPYAAQPSTAPPSTAPPYPQYSTAAFRAPRAAAPRAATAPPAHTVWSISN